MGCLHLNTVTVSIKYGNRSSAKRKGRKQCWRWRKEKAINQENGGEISRKVEMDLLNMFIQFSSVAQSCLTLSDPMDCSPPGSSIHGIFQARVLEWAAQKEQFISVLYLLKWNFPESFFQAIQKGWLFPWLQRFAPWGKDGPCGPLASIQNGQLLVCVY